MPDYRVHDTGRLEQRLNALWYDDSGDRWLGRVLRPLAYLYGLVQRWRGIPEKPANLGVPIVVVGNITVGGTGKTPLLVALCQRLMESGVRVGIVSRGYGRATRGLLEVSGDGEASDFGDEPLMMARQLQDWAKDHQLEQSWRMMVCARRRTAVDRLIEEFSPDVILSDDGLQHHGLPRDVELLVIDGERGFGNQRMLPAGPLREPIGRLASADALVINGEVGARLARQLPALSPPVFSLALEWHRLLPINALGAQVLLDMADAPVGRQLLELALVRQHWTLVAGIANPQRFFNAAREQIDAQALRLDTQCVAFADHHAFTAADFAVFHELPTAVIMTAKDAIKCRPFADELAMPCFTIETNCAIEQGLLEMILDHCQR